MNLPDKIDEWVCKKGHKGNLYTAPNGNRQCRTCKNIRARESYERNKEVRWARNEEYRKSNWERLKELSYKRRDPEKHKARQTVNNAVNSGRFPREACSECGDAKTDFHHTEGYSEDKWFVGLWLCRTHHAELHKELRRIKDRLEGRE